LFNQPDTFKRYILSSPPIFRSNGAILDDERSYAKTHDNLAARVFLAVGELEEKGDPFRPIKPAYQFVSNLQKLAKTLAGRSYPDLLFSSMIFPGETHHSVVPAACSRGLREVFR
jgi:predicted alpha/beta superfamily hydrolase